MRVELREQVQYRFGFQCGYCTVSETDAGSKLTIDHFYPQAHGGDDSLDNLIYSCHACNEFKGDYWKIESDLRLLHPISDDLDEHYREQPNGMFIPLTERGANHIEVLHLNRPELIGKRLERQKTVEFRAYCKSLESRIVALEQIFLADEMEIGRTFGFANL